MNRENSGYTIIYAAVMVIIVALGLAFTHQALNERQTANVNIDKMQQILRSLNIDASAADAQQKYDELVKNAYLITPDGMKVEGSEGTTPDDPAFSPNWTDESAAGLPFMSGSGWVPEIHHSDAGCRTLGTLWGYLAVEADGSTIYGAISVTRVRPRTGCRDFDASFLAVYGRS